MNIISAVESNTHPCLEELHTEKSKLLIRLAEIYEEEARLRFVSDALRVTAHFAFKPEPSFPMPTRGGPMVQEETNSSGIQSAQDAPASNPVW